MVQQEYKNFRHGYTGISSNIFFRWADGMILMTILMVAASVLLDFSPPHKAAQIGRICGESSYQSNAFFREGD